MTFNSTNWSLYQPVVLLAEADVDEVNGSASLTFAAEGITTQFVQVSENGFNEMFLKQIISYNGIIVNNWWE